jgi:hypothetical protein
VVPKFSARNCTPTFFRAVPNFSARTNTPIYFCAVPKFSVCTSTPIFFPIVPNFYISQAFYCASCIFSVPTYAHTFLCVSIPREFCYKNWGFFLTFSPSYHIHSTTVNFSQFHSDNTNSTYETTNHCGLTFLE